MLSRPCTDSRLLPMVAMLALVGCGGNGGIRNAPDQVTDVNSDPAVPAAAQNLYEQATEAMADGDGVDAQLRFQEFLLQWMQAVAVSHAFDSFDVLSLHLSAKH